MVSERMKKIGLFLYIPTVAATLSAGGALLYTEITFKPTTRAPPEVREFRAEVEATSRSLRKAGLRLGRPQNLTMAPKGLENPATIPIEGNLGNLAEWARQNPGLADQMITLVDRYKILKPKISKYTKIVRDQKVRRGRRNMLAASSLTGLAVGATYAAAKRRRQTRTNKRPRRRGR